MGPTSIDKYENDICVGFVYILALFNLIIIARLIQWHSNFSFSKNAMTFFYLSNKSIKLTFYKKILKYICFF